MIRFSRMRFLIATAVMAFTLVMSDYPVATASAKTLHVATHAELKSLDPIWTTAYIVRSHGYLVYDTLFAMDELSEPQPQDRSANHIVGMVGAGMSDGAWNGRCSQESLRDQFFQQRREAA